MLHLTLGTVLAVAVIWLLRRAGAKRERALWALALVVAALLYVGFALAGASWGWMAVEAAGAAVFGAAAWLGWKVSPWFLAGGWLAHVGWDVVLHPAHAAPFVPSGYPEVCLAFDVVVGLYLAYFAYHAGERRGPESAEVTCPTS